MESGHAKNVANFETITIILLALGAVYNPTQALILLPALQTKLAEAKSALDAVDAAQAAQAVKTDEVQDEFDSLAKYVVNIKRSADVEINDPAFTKDLQAIVNKFNTGSTKAKPADDPNAPPAAKPKATRSTSQRSRDNQIAYLADALALLKTKSYKTNDAEFDIPTIEARIASLTAANNADKTAAANLGNAQNERDRILYDDATGIIKLAKLIKTHLARKPGRQSAAYQQIAALEFRKPR